MKLSAALVAHVCFLTASLSFITPSSAQTPPSSDQTFIQLEHDWAEARKHNDVAFLERFYAAELTIGTLDGKEVSRAADIAKFASGDLKPTVITDDELKSRVYGQTAIVTGTEHLEGSYKGHTGQFDLRFTNLFIYRDGRWQLVRHQATPIPSR